MKKRWTYIVKIVFYLIALGFCESFMWNSIAILVERPRFSSLSLVVILIYVSYKSITAVTKVALDLSVRDYMEEHSNAK